MMAFLYFGRFVKNSIAEPTKSNGNENLTHLLSTFINDHRFLTPLLEQSEDAIGNPREGHYMK